jgi:hypothetical protein
LVSERRPSLLAKNVAVAEKDIPHLPSILAAIPRECGSAAPAPASATR